MRVLLIGFISMIFLSSCAATNAGIISLKSSNNVNITADRLVHALQSKGMTVFNRIDHAKNAKQVGKTLRPTTLIIFGNPKAGTPLMQCRQGAGLDLPQKALIREDASGQVWLSYNDPEYLAKRHRIKGCDKVLGNIGKALGNFAKAATR